VANGWGKARPQDPPLDLSPVVVLRRADASALLGRGQSLLRWLVRGLLQSTAGRGNLSVPARAVQAAEGAGFAGCENS